MNNSRFYNQITIVVLIIILLGHILVFASCSGRGNQTVNSYRDEEGESITTYAKRLSIEPGEGYSRVKIINPWQGARGVIQEWYLATRNASLPSFVNSENVIRVPIKKIICTSTTHLAMISAIGEESTVSGFSGTGFLYSREYNDRITQKTLHEIGYDDNINKELILKLEPDLVMIYGIGGESAAFAEKLKEMGLKVMINADYLETDPLGKAEWIRLFGALYSREHLADSIFRDVEEGYIKIKTLVSEWSEERPEVLLGLPYRDTWYISPGNSYISRLIEDAGGHYLWSETESAASIPMSLENVYIRALKADFWLNPGVAGSLEEIHALDVRFTGLPCFVSGNVFNNTGRTNETGGNDYWENGAISPHFLLEDIASILHPGLFPDRELVFFKKLE